MARYRLWLLVGIVAAASGCSRQGFGVRSRAADASVADAGIANAGDQGRPDGASIPVDRGVEDAGDTGAGGDAGLPVSCAGLPDETPCDDRNICSSSSSCRGGVCTGSGEVPTACTVADSRAEFGGVQGGAGWWYGYWHGEVDADGIYDPAIDFQQMVYEQDRSWHPPDNQTTPSWCYLAAWWEHPGGHPLKAPVRRWVSDVAGPALIDLRFNMGDTGGGDGARKVVIVDGIELWSKQVSGTDPAVYRAQIPVTLEVGTTIDFLLHPVDHDAQDTCEFDVAVVSP